jgi:hypothetical protein
MEDIGLLIAVRNRSRLRPRAQWRHPPLQLTRSLNLKRTILTASALFFALGAWSSFAADKMEDARKDAMEHDSMSKPAKHHNKGKADKMDKMGKSDAMEKPGAMSKTDKMEKMDKMEKPGAMQ